MAGLKAKPQPASCADERRDAPSPTAMPMSPPRSGEGEGLDEELGEDVAARARRSALRIPISRVRSRTETSMMFMIPMPPTMSEIEAIPPRSSVSVPLIDEAVASSWAWLRIVEVVRVRRSRGRGACRSSAVIAA